MTVGLPLGTAMTEGSTLKYGGRCGDGRRGAMAVADGFVE